MSFTVDGMTWTIPCSITRNANMTPSDISGMLLDKSYFNDVIGTFVNYTVRMVVPDGYADNYIQFYNTLTAPVDGHQFTFPYNGETISIAGRVEKIQDVYKRLPGNKIHWDGIQFDVIANAPSKQRTLSESISAGMTPYPDIEEVAVGETYEYTQDGWEQTSLRNVDEVPY